MRYLAGRSHAARVVQFNMTTIVIIACAGAAHAQSLTSTPMRQATQRPVPAGSLSIPVYGATGRLGLPPSSLIPTAPDIHRDYTGKACIQATGFARPLGTNPNMYDQVVQLTNNCSVRIKVKLCYYKDTTCLPVDVDPSSSKQSVLGTIPRIPEFQYEYREIY